MKLKKALKKYEIEIESWIPPSERYTIGERSIYIDPVSPMERAMRKWPIRKDDDKYILNGRHVVKGHLKSPEEYYYNDKEHDLTHYTESEAVAYLLEGYKPELKPVVFDLGVTKINGEIKVGGKLTLVPEDTQKILDTIWRAGYRPTKEEVK
jgi:hypothetical protein